ncbi:Ig-like domain-containing protein [Pareuzebyella sediminis]|uniref:Ig-like domain-containing protein n=1 Tax=Pareuzebyella sediminis TaxID=2607998 RepID=UPI0011EC9A4F|nr:hypothetical protein [Pareuzebyella sediminis]
MKAQNLRIVQAISLTIALSLFFSCSKDTDLLADYVMAEKPDAYFLKTLVINDSYIIGSSRSVTLDVLANDVFTDQNEVKIISASTPNLGTVVINKDNTITYTLDESRSVEGTADNLPTEDSGTSDTPETSENTSNQEEQSSDSTTETSGSNETTESNTETEGTNGETQQGSDTFTYTTETTNEDGTKETNEGTVTINLDYGELKAFPGAQGYGKFTTGGRAGRVIEVTNLNDSGAGSLREAVSSSGPRTIVFRVSGYINLLEPLRIKNGDITIAGQTAPGDGITIMHHGVEVLTSNVIIRYLRIRPGINSPDELDAVRVVQYKSNDIMKNIIIDHCSLSWAKDEVLSFGVNRAENSQLKNITVQNCIVSEAIDSKYGVLVMGQVNHVTFFKNYLAHNKDRQFRASTAETEFEVINNVIYNWRWGTQLSFGGKFDVIGNTYKNSNNIEQSGNAMTYIPSENTPDYVAEDGEVFQSGNIVINSNYNETNGNFRDYNSAERVHQNSYIDPSPAEAIENEVLSNAGANIFYDPVDERIKQDYINNTGTFIDSENSVGGFPNLVNAKTPETYDTDQDGMEDSWEIQNGLDPNDPSDASSDQNSDGFTNLEDFLHFLTL